VTPEPLTETPPYRVRRPVFRQSWRDLTMLHWPVAPEVVAPLLPAGTTPDLLDGVIEGSGGRPFEQRFEQQRLIDAAPHH